MSLKFRNLTVTPDDPAEKWGTEGIVTVIDRGTSKRWAQINRGIQANPYGPLATQLEEALLIAESDGVTALMRGLLEEARMSDAQRLARDIRYWVRTSGKSRAELAALLGTSRSRLSSYENGHVVPAATVVEVLRGLSERRRADLAP